MHAKSQNSSVSIQPVTVTSLKSEILEQPSYFGGGDNPSDAPLGSEVYSYELAVHTACANLVTRYQSPFDYFPSAFAPDVQIPAHVGKREIAYELPLGREMKMPIVSRKQSHDPACQAQR